MERQIQAERARRSHVLRADGDREGDIIQSRGDAAKVVLQADGQRASELLKAKGQAEARRLLANAEATSLACVRQVVEPYGIRGVDYLAAVEYLNSLAKATQSGSEATVIFIPADSVDIIGQIMSAHGDGPKQRK